MIRIDSDTHFTPLDAFTDLDPKYPIRGRAWSPYRRTAIASTIRRGRRLNQQTQPAASFDPAVYAIPAVARRRTAAQCYYDAVNVIRGISLTRRA
jgi:hypothetical protein